MLKFLTKNRVFIIGFLAISFFYFILRLPNLTLQPIFADEAIYIRWAQVMRAEPTLRFLPLSDGKTPFFMWLMIPFLKVFQDPLFAGRFLSVLAGFITLLGVMAITRMFFSQRSAIIAGFLVAITPFSIFFDRMALVDSMLASFSVWSFFIAVLLVKYKRIDLAMLLGYLLGGGLLTKTPFMLNIFSLPSTILVFEGWRSKSRGRQLLKLVGLWSIAIVIALGIYNILRLGPGFSRLNSRNEDYVFPLSRLLEHPLDPLIPHIKDMSSWFVPYLGPAVLILIVIGLYKIIRTKNLIGVSLIAWFVIPLLIEMLFYKTFTARYILSSIPFLLIIASLGLDYIFVLIKNNLFKIILIIVITAWPLYFNYLLLTNPAKAPMPQNERRGYLEDWTAGYGFKEIAKYIRVKSVGKTSVVGTEGYFGTLPDGLQIYLDKDLNVAFMPDKATVSAGLRDASNTHLTFFVANRNRFRKADKNMVLISEYPKTKGKELDQDAIVFYQVFPLTASGSAVVK